MLDFSDIGKYKENNRIEAKKALGGLPESIWETYSAFANTLGGVILLGVEELPGRILRCVNLPDPERMIGQFLEILQNKDKVSANILPPENVRIHEIGGNRFVSIDIPRAQRSDKPVYINHDLLSGTYRRNGEGDYRCTPEEIQAMLRDASLRTQDMRVLGNLDEHALNPASIALCRAHSKAPRGLKDLEFLVQYGLAAAIKGEGIRPTAAGLLLFGILPEIVGEFPGYRLRYVDTNQKTERLDQNLMDFYFTVLHKLIEREDLSGDPALKKAVQEAFVNCLVNADYSGTGGILITNSPDRIEFSNPGSFRVNKDAVFGGGLSDPRNAILFRIFQSMKLGSGTGSGIQSIFSIWKKHGFAAPEITERFKPDRITVTLPLSSKMRSQKKAFGAANITAGAAAIVEYLTDNVSADAETISVALGICAQQTRECIALLLKQNIITAQDGAEGVLYYLRA